MLLSCKLLVSEFIPEEACFHRPPVAAGAVSQSIISRIIICTAQAHGFGMFSCEAFLCRVVLDVWPSHFLALHLPLHRLKALLYFAHDNNNSRQFSLTDPSPNLPKLLAGEYKWMVQVTKHQKPNWSLPRCPVNRRHSGEPTLSQPFRVQGFFEARWVRHCCLVSWSSWSLTTHFYWRLSFSSRGHLQPTYFHLMFERHNSFSTWLLRNQVLASSSVEAFLLSWQRPIAMLASRPLSRWSLFKTLWENLDSLLWSITWGQSYLGIMVCWSSENQWSLRWYGT